LNSATHPCDVRRDKLSTESAVTTPLHTRAGQLIRLMLSSDQVGEVAGSAMALNRVITARGMDVHQFADIVVAALDREPLAEKSNELEWMQVDSLTLSRYQKPGSRPTIRARYTVGAASYFDCWAFEHDGLAHEIAAEKWLRLGGATPVPLTVDQTVERQDELCAGIEIQVRHDGRFWSVIGQRIREMESTA
jgi:hypothetical protein